MPPSSFLLTACIALCDFAHASLDLGSARVDVDVFMTLEHGKSSMTTLTTTTEAIPSPTTQYSESTQPDLHPYSKATSYVGSAWRDLTNGLHESRSTDSSQSPIFEPTLGSTTDFGGTTHPTLHPYSKVTSYVGSAWRDMSANFQEFHSSSLTIVTPSVTLATSVDQIASSTEASQVVPKDQGSSTYVQHSEATSVIVDAGRPTTCRKPLLSKPTAASSSCSSFSGDPLRANVTNTWAWPPVVSASPSSGSPHMTNSTPSYSPIVAQSKVDGKPISDAGAWCMAIFLLLVAEARGRL